MQRAHAKLALTMVSMPAGMGCGGDLAGGFRKSMLLALPFLCPLEWAVVETAVDLADQIGEMTGFYARWNGLWWRPVHLEVSPARRVLFLCPLEWAVVETRGRYPRTNPRPIRFSMP